MITAPPRGSVNVFVAWNLEEPANSPSYDCWEAAKFLSPEFISERSALTIKCVKKLPFQEPKMMKVR